MANAEGEDLPSFGDVAQKGGEIADGTMDEAIVSSTHFVLATPTD